MCKVGRKEKVSRGKIGTIYRGFSVPGDNYRDRHWGWIMACSYSKHPGYRVVFVAIKRKKKGPCHWYPGRHNAINTKLQAPNWTIIRRKKGKRKRNVKKKKKPITPDHQLHLPCKINRPRGHIDDTCIAMELPIIWGRHAKFVDAERNQIVTSSVVRSSKVLEVLFGELLACLCHKVSSED